ncbi:MAG: cytochrome c oxidase subunit II [Elusimicrobia bacterium]|nr:cytochrome c oxidase subunit II [Elusimicrobiota bacterium]
MNGYYGWGLPVAASTYAHDIDFGIIMIHVAMFVIFILWGIFFTYLLIRYRRREGVPAERERDHGALKSLLPDIIVMIFEIGLIVFYAIPSWSRIKMNFPDPSQSNQVDVIAEQFAWNVHYPGADGKFGPREPRLVHFSNPIGLDRDKPAAQDDIVFANEIHMPVGKPTLIKLSSKDVIHSFFVPEFRIKQDAMPGMVIPVWVTPTQTGTFEISCAQLCGFAHSFMRGEVVVQTQEDFDAWLKSRAPAKQEAPAKASESW